MRILIIRSAALLAIAMFPAGSTTAFAVESLFPCDCEASLHVTDPSSGTDASTQEKATSSTAQGQQGGATNTNAAAGENARAH